MRVQGGHPPPDPCNWAVSFPALRSGDEGHDKDVQPMTGAVRPQRSRDAVGKNRDLIPA